MKQKKAKKTGVTMNLHHPNYEWPKYVIALPQSVHLFITRVNRWYNRQDRTPTEAQCTIVLNTARAFFWLHENMNHRRIIAQDDPQCKDI